MAENILQVASLSKTYSGVKALVDFDFSIKQGEVHCLVGENGSGKSTFMKIIAGVVRPDRDSRTQILINGKQFRRLTPKDSMNEGIQVIYQDLSLFPNLTVAENIAMNQRIEENRKTVSWKEMRRTALDSMEQISVKLDPEELVENYPIAKQQLVAICRAITSGVQLLIMDEPTASLGKTDVEHFFKVIRKLKERGISALFIGHKLHEVFAIADRITVIRDGKRIKTFDSVSETNEHEITELMIGKTIDSSKRYESKTNGKPLMEIRGLSKSGQYSDVNFTLYPGDIIGIIGLTGAGRTELALSVFGLNKPDTGEILIDNKPVSIESTRDAIKNEIALVPENRLVQGLFTEKTIMDNVLITTIDEFRKYGPFLSKKEMVDSADSWIDKLNIKTPSAKLPVKQLSGGNQQRVVLSKWLATKPRILILDGPTVGIDVGAKAEIHRYIQEMAQDGIGIIMMSDEIHEVLHNANKILVMREGRIIKSADATSLDETDLMQLLQ